MEAKQLTNDEKKIIKSVFLRSHLSFLNFNMVKMMANGFTFTMIPVIESLYKNNPTEKKEAYIRHQNFFNTHAVPFAFIAGLTYAMEKEHAEKNSIDGSTISNIKTSLMGPTAGMFDSLFFNCLRIIAAGIGIGFSAQGSLLGPIIFVLLYGLPQSIVKYFFVKYGYSYGTTFIDMVFSSGLMAALTKSAGVLGLMMVGAMTAQMVNVPLSLMINIGGAEVVLADVFNSIMPGLLGIILLFVLVKFIKKGVRPTWLILAIFVFSLLGAFVGIF